MFKKISSLIVLLCIITVGFTQKKELNLEQIWSYKFHPNHMNALSSMNGPFYSLLGENRRTIDKYSYRTFKKISTVFNVQDVSDFTQIESYSFNTDESKIIIGTKLTPVYRRSNKGTYYVYDLATKKLTLIGNQIQEPTFSPKGAKVAFVKENDIYIKDLLSNSLITVTSTGKVNHVINGITDWVNEEEFAFVKAFEWSKDGENIAFLKFDESAVKSVTIDTYNSNLYPEKYTFKYPKAGETNAKVTLHLFNLKSKNTSKVDLGTYHYIARLQWTEDPNYVSVTTLNRHQNDLKLHFVDVRNNKAKVILNEKDVAYVEVQDNLTFLENNSFIWTSERDGFNHIYLYNKKGKLKKQLTKGNWDVTRYYGLNKKNKKIYYQSVENGSINRGVYTIDLKGRNKKLLTASEGISSASFSKNFEFFINRFSSSIEAPSYSLYQNDKKVRTLKDNKFLEQQLQSYKISKKEFSTIRVNGNDLNMWMIKPLDFDSTKKYPVLLHQYSGPGSQLVKNSWNNMNDYWHQMIAQKGVIVVCVDGRGTGFKGRDFKKVTQLKLGEYEVEDQISVAKKMRDLPYVDGSRIGIWGWSFGGFMSTNCLLKGNDVFKMAIAVAPVTSWRFYDTIYTERFMKTPQENPEGYDENSPIEYPEKLKGDYLLIHGSGDDNVHVQNANRMIDALINADKRFDSEIYPGRTHGIYKGRNTRLHLYRKMTRFIEDNLIKI